MEYIQLSAIKLNPNNPRRIKGDNFKSLVESIKRDPEYLEKRGIVIADGIILGGNQRYLAIKEALKDEAFRESLGLEKDMIPALWVVDASEWSEEKRRRFAIVDNGMWGEWDFDILANEWSDLPLNDLGIDLPEDWLDIKDNNIDEEDIEEQINRAEELNKKWKVKAGDLYRIGEHRLICGDCTDKETMDRVMQGEKADMVFTDPPYGVSYADKNKFLNAIDEGNRNETPIINDAFDIDLLIEKVLYPAFCMIKENLSEKSSYYITAPQGGNLLLKYLLAMDKAGIPLRHMLIWVKNNHVLGRTDYNYKHEPILYGWVNSHVFYGLGKYKFSTWEIDKPLKSELHPTMKPIELVENAILNSSKSDDVVLDSFIGSGTTMVACEKTGRKCRGVEISPEYCAVILQRMTDAFPDVNIEKEEL